MPGRIRAGYHAGACRQCGRHDLSSAPANCDRCAFEIAVTELKRAPAVSRDALLGNSWSFACAEDLTRVVEHLRAGRIEQGRYQSFVDPGDKILRPMHAADNVQGLFEHQSAAAAEEVADACYRTGMFDSAWVLTHHGIWRVLPR